MTPEASTRSSHFRCLLVLLWILELVVQRADLQWEEATPHPAAFTCRRYVALL